jgi:hypothetical protein
MKNENEGKFWLVTIPSDIDLDHAKLFYEQFLGIDGTKQSDGTWNFIPYRIKITHEDRPIGRYEKGKTPRMEIRVEDIKEWEQCAVEAGAVVKSRLFKGKQSPQGNPSTYIWLVDPYGHVWTLQEELKNLP